MCQRCSCNNNNEQNCIEILCRQRLAESDKDQRDAPPLLLHVVRTDDVLLQ